MTDDEHSDDADDADDADDVDGAGESADGDGRSPSETSAERGGVLTPDELNISENEYVEELDDDGRYVVSPGDEPPDVPASKTTPGRAGAVDSGPGADSGGSNGGSSGASPAGQRGRGQGDTPASPEAARSLLAAELGRTNADYGLDVVARFGTETVRHRTASNDVVGTFENLVRWYARNVTDDTPVDDAVAILLREANLAPTGGADRSLATLLDAHGLEEDDSIADLVAAIRADAAGTE
jgi:hypothetical protein